MKIIVQQGRIEKIKTDAVVVFVLDEEEIGREAERLDKVLVGMIRRLIRRGDFRPKLGNIGLIYPADKILAERLILAGLGRKAGLTAERLRQAAGRAAAYARGVGAKEIVFGAERSMGLDMADLGQAICEGATLGLYRFLKYKTNEDVERNKDISKITLLVEKPDDTRKAQAGVKVGSIISRAVMMARDMVNHPAMDMTPSVIADIARDISRKYGLRLKVLDRKDMERLGMGGLLGVAAGSAQPPKFIIVEYRGGGKKPFIALVGKTITFDSGGISLKPAENMDKMKSDMAGGAAVLGTMMAAAGLELKLNIVGLLPATENMPGGRAYKPGDVLKTLSGQTIEIINTDAEGRLILADALSYALRYKPSAILDIATLTGACRIALGQEAIGMMGNNDDIKEKVRAAGERTGERVWELPLWEGYYELIKSDIADMKNSGGRDGGAITAACLLSKFVEKYPWVHLDIAATAWTDKERPYTPKGATGVGVRILTRFLMDL